MILSWVLESVPLLTIVPKLNIGSCNVLSKFMYTDVHVADIAENPLHCRFAMLLQGL